MDFRVGDKVIFKPGVYFTVVKDSGFTVNKEYIILEEHLDQFNNIYYTLDNVLGSRLKIYKRHIIISPSYKRNETINQILK